MRFSAGTRRVCAPDWYCASTRPVTRYTGASGRRSSAGPLAATATIRARPSAVAKPSANSRGVPRCRERRARAHRAGPRRARRGSARSSPRDHPRWPGPSSSKTAAGSRSNRHGAPEPSSARSASTSSSLRASPGASTALRRRSTRPSRLVIVPSSSAHWVTGSTTSASSVVSLGTRSQTTSRSSAASRRRTALASGALTTGLLPCTNSARTSPPQLAEQLDGGNARAGQRLRGRRPTPRRRARGRAGPRCCGSRAAGRTSARARGRPARCPARSGSRSQRRGRPGRPSARARLIAAVTVSVPSACCSTPRPVSTIAPAAAVHRRRVGEHAARPRRSWGSGTPVIAATRCRPPGGDRASYLVPAGRTTREVRRSSTRPSATSDVQHPQQQHEIRARKRLQVQPGPSVVPARPSRRRRGSTTTSPPRSRTPARCCTNGGIVSATLLPSSSTAPARPMSVDRERQPAVDAEGPVARRRGRRHAEPAVVVDVPGAERDPRELAELVGLLVGQPAAAEDADRSRRRARSQRR